MNPLSWVAEFRWPLEIAGMVLAVVPLLIVLRAWDTLPEEIPAHFGITGRPDRWGGRWQIWILPILALVMYGAFSFATGTWDLLLGRPREMPQGLELLVLMKPLICLMLSYLIWATVRVARKEAERLNPWITFGLVALLIAPGVALAFLVKK